MTKGRIREIAEGVTDRLSRFLAPLGFIAGKSTEDLVFKALMEMGLEGPEPVMPPEPKEYKPLSTICLEVAKGLGYSNYAAPMLAAALYKALVGRVIVTSWAGYVNKVTKTMPIKESFCEREYRILHPEIPKPSEPWADTPVPVTVTVIEENLPKPEPNMVIASEEIRAAFTGRMGGGVWD